MPPGSGSREKTVVCRASATMIASAATSHRIGRPVIGASPVFGCPGSAGHDRGRATAWARSSTTATRSSAVKSTAGEIFAVGVDVVPSPDDPR